MTTSSRQQPATAAHGYHGNCLWYVCLLLVLTACSGQSAPQTPVTAQATPTLVATTALTPAATATTAAAVPTSPPTPVFLVARVGINAAFEPFVFKDATGQVVGFDIDLITAMSKVGNFEVTYIDSPFDALLPGVESGALEAAISAITVTEERAAHVRFSDVYFRAGQAPVSYFNPGQGLAVRQDETAIVGAANLTAAVKVGVKADTTGAQFVTTQTPAAAVSYPEAEEALAALRNHDVDAVVVDIPVIVRYINNNPNAGVRITGGPLTDEQYAIAVNPTRRELLERFNTALAQLQADGTYAQIFAKWFGTP